MKRLSVMVAVLGVALAAADVSLAQGWVQLTAPSTDIGPIACSADGSRLLLGDGYWGLGGDVLYVSHDSGVTWAPAAVPTGGWSAVASSAEGTVLMALMATNNRIRPDSVFISTNSGANWSRAALPVAWWQGVACSANGAVLYATASRTTNGSPEGIYASADRGATWSPAGTVPPTTNGDWGPVACSADGTRVMVGAGANVWISTNSGLNLRLAYTLDPPSGDQLVCASLACSADGRKVAVGTAYVGGIDYTHVAVATSADSGATCAWTSSQVPGYWPVYDAIWRPVCVSANGRRLAAAGGGGPIPAGGLPMGPVLVSEDSGASWVMPLGVADPASYPGGVPPGTTDSVTMWSGLAMSTDGSRLTGVFMDGCCGSFDPGVVAQQTALAPVIDIGVSAGQLVLSWVVPSANLALQQSSDIGAASWTNVPAAPVLNYSTLREEVTVPSSGRRMFYRLVSRP
jgi:hypothetical protein